jgi:hypothetical protein
MTELGMISQAFQFAAINDGRRLQQFGARQGLLCPSRNVGFDLTG